MAVLTQPMRDALAAQATANYGNPNNALIGLLLDLLELVPAAGAVQVREGSGDHTIPAGALWYEYAAESGAILVDDGTGPVTRPDGFSVQPCLVPGGLATSISLTTGAGTPHWRYAIAV